MDTNTCLTLPYLSQIHFFTLACFSSLINTINRLEKTAMNFLQEDLILLSKIVTGNDQFSVSGSINVDAEEGLTQPQQTTLITDNWDCKVSQTHYVIYLGKTKKQLSGYKSKRYEFINNPDGSIRWLIPEQARQATFLSFYNASTLKAKVISKIIKMAYNTGLKRFIVNGSLSVYYRDELFLEEKFQGIPFKNYSIFTGTVGPNRKVIAELNDENAHTTNFVKIPLTQHSSTLVKNEVDNCTLFGALNWDHCTFPRAYWRRNVGIFENQNKGNLGRSNKFTNPHIKYIRQQAEVHSSIASPEKITAFQSMKEVLHSLNDTQNLGFASIIKEQVLILEQELESYDFFITAPAHMDFTPWNMYCNDDTLYVYDLELAQQEIPLFFDLFHFVFQTHVLLHRNTYTDIKTELASILAHPYLAALIKDKGIEVNRYFKFYLFYTATYYLNTFLQQHESQKLHMQANWLMEMWAHALLESNRMRSEMNKRQEMISMLFEFLKNKPYALLKHTEANIASIPETSDLDILIDPARISEALQFIQSFEGIEKLRMDRKQSLYMIEIFFDDGSFLEIDLIYQFMRKGQVFLNAQEVLRDAAWNMESIKVASLEHNLAYITLFYALNYADVPNKYIRYYHSHSQQQLQYVKTYFRNELGLEGPECLFYYNEEEHRNIKQKVRHKHGRYLSKRVLNLFYYLWGIVRSAFKNRGIVITISGVDGAGKSTIIQNLKERLKDNYRRNVVVIRHRPSLLPILSSYKHGREAAEKKAAETLPRKGNNKSKLGSLVRFIYYLSDYVLGQFYIYLKYTMRGYVIIYDRYYFDFINDSKRSNIVISKSVVKAFYKLIFKPDINVLLYAQPEVIIQRKQELSLEDIKSLTRDYKDLFESYDKKYKYSRYLSIENNDLERTLSGILREFKAAA